MFRNLLSAVLVIAASPLVAEVSMDDLVHISLNQGLSQTTVLTIQQDAAGSLWFGTEDGLNRFDGSEIEVFRSRPYDPSSLPANYIRALARDAEGGLWLGTEGGGVAYLDPASGRFVRVDSGDFGRLGAVASQYVRDILVASDGVVWAGLQSGGLERIDPMTLETVRYRHDDADPFSLVDDRVSVLHESRNGMIWVGTRGGLDLFDPTTGEFLHFYESPKNKGIRALYEDRDGILWFGTEARGLYRLNPANGRLLRFSRDAGDDGDSDDGPADDRVRAILEDQAGRLWVGSLAGLDLFDRATRRFHHYGQELSEAVGDRDAGVLSLHQDDSGALWVGTRHSGLVYWQPDGAPFERHRLADGDPTGDIVTSFAEDAAGRIFIGTFGAGIAQVDRGSGEVMRIERSDNDGDSDGLSDDRVMSLLTDRYGRLWIGTKAGGLNRFDPSTGTFRNFAHDPGSRTSLPADGVMSLFEDKAGNLWVGTFGGGLSRFDEATETFQTFSHDPSVPTSVSSDRITCIADAKKGLLWVGTDGGGLNLFDPASGKAMHFRHDANDSGSLPADTVLSLHVDAGGALWVGTRGGGLARMMSSPWNRSGVTFQVFAEREGLPNPVIYAIRPDDQGGLWLSSNRGLSRFDPLTLEVVNFDVRHGLQANEFNFGAAFRSASGELFFGGVNGYNSFHPETVLGGSPGGGARFADVPLGAGR